MPAEAPVVVAAEAPQDAAPQAEAPEEQQPAQPAGTLTVEQILEFAKLEGDPDAAASYLAGVLALPEYQTDARSAIRLDYVTYALTFTKEAAYGPTSTASLLSVAHNLLEATASGATYEQLEATFKSQMLERTSPKPGPDSHLFSPNQVASIARFFTRTFFRHWRLYSHCLHHPQEVSECTVNLLVETARIPGFEDAVSAEEWAAAAQAAAEAEAQAAAQAQADALTAAEQAKNAAAAAAADADERRRQEELARKPATLEEAVEHLVALRLDAEKKVLAAEYQAKEEALRSKIAEVEAVAAAPTAKK